MTDGTDPLTAAERDILKAFHEACDLNDFSACTSWLALTSPPNKAERNLIRGLRTRGFLRLERGGTDEDGYLVGGTFYAVTKNGRAALAWTPQQELSL